MAKARTNKPLRVLTVKECNMVDRSGEPGIFIVFGRIVAQVTFF